MHVKIWIIGSPQTLIIYKLFTDNNYQVPQGIDFMEKCWISFYKNENLGAGATG